MPTIYPTGHCFDDALELLAEFVSQHPARRAAIALVHGLARHEASHADAGKYYAHAWVEVDGEVWESGLLGRAPVRYSVERGEYYRERQVGTTTRYTVDEALAENRRTGHYGPWVLEYRLLCRQARREPPSIAAVDVLDPGNPSTRV